MRVCGCAGARVRGCAGARVCGCAGVRVCGCVGVRVCAYARARVRACVGIYRPVCIFLSVKLCYACASETSWQSTCLCLYFLCINMCNHFALCR